ncbi:MAG: chemotaxis response regulator protein-glutamate methylesterase [Nitrospirae bacterium]|nr:MAG: chemotaxis response regulator protein-glutamate methylesterase [Nitrospirota bacterium]
MSKGKIKILIVDDSAFIRSALSKMLGSDPQLQVVGTARDGVEAIDKTLMLKPDVITLDVDMPRMNGLEALKVIMDKQPTRVIMVSAYTTEGAEETIKALELGAIDFIPKNLAESSINILNIKEELILKVKQVAGSKIYRKNGIFEEKREISLSDRSLEQAGAEIVTIGSSTGGPRALQEVIPKLPGNFPVPVLIAQHMPASFTKVLADRLNQISKVRVKEAEDGEIVEPSTAYIAPGGKHMILLKLRGSKVKIKLLDGNENLIYKPSVDLLMMSASDIYTSATLGVILTGMGHDGLKGAQRIKQRGGKTIVQDKETSTIYGMPRAVIDAGLADRVLPLYDIALEIVNSV